MTVTYTANLHTAQKCSTAANILLRWRGSVYQLVIVHLYWYTLTFVTIALIYHFLLPLEPHLKLQYEWFCLSCSHMKDSIPLTFLMGFYITQVLLRSWQQFRALPWPENLITKVSSHLGERGSHFVASKVAVARYINLAIILALRRVSIRAAKRFETLQGLIDCKLLTEAEMEELEQVLELESERKDSGKHTQGSTIYILPLTWTLTIIRQLYELKLLPDYVAYQDLVSEVHKIGDQLRVTGFYAWINFPLAYTQVISFSTYFCMGLHLFSEQQLWPDQDHWQSLGWSMKHPNASLIPSLLLPLKYCCYLGLLKGGLIAETALNPLGEDDDDFDIGFIVDRNLEVSLQIAKSSTFDVLTLPDEDPLLPSDSVQIPHTLDSQSLADREYGPPSVVDLLHASQSQLNWPFRTHFGSLKAKPGQPRPNRRVRKSSSTRSYLRNQDRIGGDVCVRMTPAE